MTESAEHPYVEWIAREARRPVVTDQGARDRIMAAVRAEPVPVPLSRPRRFWSRIAEPRVVRRSPVTSGLLAAGLVGLGVLAGGLTNNWGARSGGQPQAGVAQRPPVSPGTVTDTVVQFVYVGPQASKVSLVGDFNGWDATRTPMVRAANGGVWTVTLPLTTGRHLYAFVVDGTTWASDPGAPLAPDDGFGHVNSVKNVRGPAL